MRSRFIAPAKVNLFLGVGAVRPDGYHEVDHRAPGARVRRRGADPARRRTRGDDLSRPGDPRRARTSRSGRPSRSPRSSPSLRAWSIEIEKRMPAGAGLAGGSSDAAAVLAGLARLHDIAPCGERCVAVARSLGADCAFFLYGGAALMTGRGDELETALPSRGRDVVLVKPPSPVPTSGAYRAVRPRARCRRPARGPSSRRCGRGTSPDWQPRSPTT